MKFNDGYWLLRPGVTAHYAVEALDVRELGGVAQPPIQLVGPAVVDALERLAVAGAARDRPGAVAAHVVEAMQCPIGGAGHHQRLAG